MRNFRDLKVWEKGHRMTLAVYKATATFPHDELYGLTSQIRRSCVSVPANTAEGCGRGSETLLANELRLFEAREYRPIAMEVTEVKRMLASFIRKLKADR